MKIGRYEIIDEIGQGAMGTVYLATDPLIERDIAIKTVPVMQLREAGTEAETRFLREARSAGRLSHPSIVTIYDVGEANGVAYIAMEFLSGTTLREIMDRGPMPLDLVLDTAIQMAEALAFAHENGVVHRDIKPANVMVTGQRGRIKLTDFGIAHHLNSQQTLAGQMLGSPRYMSPEQAMGHEVTGRSDMFSLGVVLYEMLAGRYAFDGDSLPTILYRVVNDTPAALESMRRDLIPGLAGVIRRMMHKRPELRPDAHEVINAMHALRATPTPTTAPVRVAAPLPVSLKLLAFTTPLGVFLLIGISIIVIGHFLPRTVVTAPVSSSAPSTPPPEMPLPASPDASPSGPAPTTAPVAPVSVPARTPRKTPPVIADAYLIGLDNKIVELRIKRTDLLLRYTEQHPDVVQIDRQLEQLALERREHVRLLQRAQSR